MRVIQGWHFSGFDSEIAKNVDDEIYIAKSLKMFRQAILSGIKLDTKFRLK